MPERSRGAFSNLRLTLGWIAALWVVFALDVMVTFVFGPGLGKPRAESFHGGLLPALFGLRPRSTWGLIGIPCAPFLHAGLAHILANSIGLLFLGWASCAVSRKHTAIVCLYAMLVSGCLTWVIGNPDTIHVGASGVLFGLIGFLALNGLVRFSLGNLLLAAATVWFYFPVALPGMMPGAQGPQGMPISWQMHLGGFVGGLLAAWQLRPKR